MGEDNTETSHWSTFLQLYSYDENLSVNVQRTLEIIFTTDLTSRHIMRSHPFDVTTRLNMTSPHIHLTSRHHTFWRQEENRSTVHAAILRTNTIPANVRTCCCATWRFFRTSASFSAGVPSLLGTRNIVVVVVVVEVLCFEVYLSTSLWQYSALWHEGLRGSLKMWLGCDLGSLNVKKIIGPTMISLFCKQGMK